jgi:hypothetical protein
MAGFCRGNCGIDVPAIEPQRTHRASAEASTRHHFATAIGLWIGSADFKNGPRSWGERLSNTPVPGKRFVLKFPDERRTEGFITQTTYTRGSSGVSGRVCEERYAAERVLPQSAVELRYAESAPEGATLKTKGLADCT